VGSGLEVKLTTVESLQMIRYGLGFRFMIMCWR
jgi:hypothetical protein